MFLGSRVDESLTHYYRHWLEHRERLGLRVAQGGFCSHMWKQQARRRERQARRRLGRAPGPASRGAQARASGRSTIAFEELLPRLGEPVAVQRRVEFRLVPEIREWTIEGHLDLETRRPGARAPMSPSRRSSTTRSRPAVAITEDDRRAQPAGQPCTSPPAGSRAGPPHDFQFAQIPLTPAALGARRSPPRSSPPSATSPGGCARCSRGSRSRPQPDRRSPTHCTGPDRPWGFAYPTSWKRGLRYCEHWRADCPGGAGL